MAHRGLFDTTVAESELDPAFVHVRDHDDCAEDRDYLHQAWRFYRPLADAHFHDQFQRRGHFQARAWELRLAWTLHKVGHELTSERPLGPDLTVRRSPRVHFEAVAPQPTHALIENERQAHIATARVPEDDMILRATGVIAAKCQGHRKYQQAGVVSLNEPYVIAISGANISMMAPPSVGTMEAIAELERRIVTGEALQSGESQMFAGGREQRRHHLASRGCVALKFRVDEETRRYYRWLERTYLRHGPRRELSRALSV